MTAKILGYRRDGTPIHPNKPGSLVTACIISCSLCKNMIKGMGGPAQGAACVACYMGLSGEQARSFSSSMELFNAYGPLHGSERIPGLLKVVTHSEDGQTVHMVSLHDGTYRADMPVSMETLKHIRECIDDYINYMET